MTESSAAQAEGASVAAASPGAGVAVRGGGDGPRSESRPADLPAQAEAEGQRTSGGGDGAQPGAAESAVSRREARELDQDQDSPAGLTRGIWWAAALLPFLSVAGAVLCFAAGVLNTGGCQPEGSALCTGGGQWFTFVLPLLVAPLTAAVTAIGAVTFHRHRSTWLAVGYFVVFVSLLLGLAAANSGTV
ncbi:MAG TPA: hypothetical protein VGX23_19130 [Actinocrinis sp.]|nr:hypothetical protein [Actinocrinis sp.]